MDKIIKSVNEGKKFSYIKTILPGLKYIINKNIHKYIILISVKDTNEIPDDLKDALSRDYSGLMKAIDKKRVK